MPRLTLFGREVKRIVGEKEKMLNFEEIKKFKPTLEVEQIEDAVYQEDLTDMTDILREMMQQQTK